MHPNPSVRRPLLERFTKVNGEQLYHVKLYWHQGFTQPPVTTFTVGHGKKKTTQTSLNLSKF
jgi:hypothetical protein